MTRLLLILAFAVCGMTMVSGCMSRPKGAGNFDYTPAREPMATSIPVETSVVAVSHSPEQFCSRRPVGETPLTVMSDQPEFVDLPLEEAIHIALTNSQLIRSSGQPQALSDGRMASVFDPIIQDSNYLFGQRGVAAALSDFDARATTSMIWGRSELVQNNTFLSGGVLPGDTLVGETGAFQSRLERNLRRGGQVTMSHDWNYEGSNRQDLLFPSVYTGATTLQFRQPLLAGYGKHVTDVAGPQANALQGVTGVSQGLLVAQMNTKMSIVDFEIAVAGLLREVERTFWQLQLAHVQLENLDAVQARIAGIAERVESRIASDDVGASAIEAAEVEQALLRLELQRSNYVSEILEGDSQLRKLLRLPQQPGIAFRPSRTPSTAPVVFDWYELVRAAEANRPEVRRQQLSVEQLRHQVAAAKNLARARLDFVSSYQLNGFGDQLLDRDPVDLESAYKEMFDSNETGWSLGFQFSKVVGQRFTKTRLRNLQLQHAKANGVLNELRSDIETSLASAVREVDRSQKELQLQRKITLAAERNRDATESRFRAVGDSASLLIWLRAELAAAESTTSQVASEIGYTQSLAEVQFQAGSTLSLNCMQVAPMTSQIIWHANLLSSTQSSQVGHTTRLPAPEPVASE